jgi:hypothetical protein
VNALTFMLDGKLESAVAEAVGIEPEVSSPEDYMEVETNLNGG